MRRIVVSILVAMSMSMSMAGAVVAQPQPSEKKKNANPCRDEVAAALSKLRKSSWFRMETSMITEKGPTKMAIDYKLPDRMHQTVTVQATKDVSEIILVGDEAWSKQGKGAWTEVPSRVTQQLRTQMQESVVDEQEEVGNYSCKGRTQLHGRDVVSYKLVDEGTEDSEAPRNEAYRMFYVDAVTGLPVSNTLVVPGREDRPLFEARYSFPLDMTIEPPEQIAKNDAKK